MSPEVREVGKCLTIFVCMSIGYLIALYFVARYHYFDIQRLPKIAAILVFVIPISMFFLNGPDLIESLWKLLK